MAQIRIYPYKMGSQSASRLAESLREGGHRCFKVYPDRNYRPRTSHVIINWGSSSRPGWMGWPVLSNVLNWPMAIEEASNKLTAFRRMQEAGVSTPEFTTDINEAWEWYRGGQTVVGRAKLSGHSGEGVYISDSLDYPSAEGGMDIAHMSEVAYGIGGAQRPLPLYVKYIKKKDEYRVHVFRGRVIDIQQKRKRRDMENERVNYQVRSHNNGWVFCRSDIRPAQSVLDNAVAAVNALGLDFGAVDVIWNDYQGQAYVLEVNTAPGLEGQTVDAYVNAIEEEIL